MKSVFAVVSNLVVVLGIVAVSAGSIGCCKDGKKGDKDIMDADTNAATGDSDSGNAEGLQTIQFPYDSYVLDTAAKEVLKANADVLKDKASLQIQVEGHCDERGGIQYNLALGEKRANAVRSWLMDKGIDGGRITTISFGEERPLSNGHDEGAWAKNRRANFVVTAK